MLFTSYATNGQTRLKAGTQSLRSNGHRSNSLRAHDSGVAGEIRFAVIPGFRSTCPFRPKSYALAVCGRPVQRTCTKGISRHVLGETRHL
jgi:hypothetical protein